MKYLVIAIITLCSFSLSAKDLTARLGVGYNAQITDAASALSVKYALSSDYALSGLIGFRAGGDNNDSSVIIGAKAYRNAYQEDNANFYLGAGLALTSIETSTTTSETGFDILAFIGTEFFLKGLPNLGLTFESGVDLTSRGKGITFETVSGSFVTTGMHYYF